MCVMSSRVVVVLLECLQCRVRQIDDRVDDAERANGPHLLLGLLDDEGVKDDDAAQSKPAAEAEERHQKVLHLGLPVAQEGAQDLYAGDEKESVADKVAEDDLIDAVAPEQGGVLGATDALGQQDCQSNDLKKMNFVYRWGKFI